MATDAKTEMSQNTFGIPFPSFIYPGIFFSALILKFGGLRIMGLGGRTVKAHCALLCLVKRALLHIG